MCIFVNPMVLGMPTLKIKVSLDIGDTFQDNRYSHIIETSFIIFNVGRLLGFLINGNPQIFLIYLGVENFIYV